MAKVPPARRREETLVLPSLTLHGLGDQDNFVGSVGGFVEGLLTDSSTSLFGCVVSPLVTTGHRIPST